MPSHALTISHQTAWAASNVVKHLGILVRNSLAVTIPAIYQPLSIANHLTFTMSSEKTTIVAAGLKCRPAAGRRALDASQWPKK